MRTGRIKWYNAFQSHGYIVLNDGTEVYFHSTGIRNSGLISRLNPGIDVCFDLLETRSGPEALNIDLIG
ncbi:MAG: cold-shock protein [Calothrix sp. SM1_5_4]|nr:cold-shock protein [Calothrix sp. SM1_5_4]